MDDKIQEIKDLLQIYKLNCCSLAYSCDDTEVEEDIIQSLEKIEERILELAKTDNYNGATGQTDLLKRE